MDKLDYVEYDFKQMLETGKYHVTPGDIRWLIEQVKKLRSALKFYEKSENPKIAIEALEDS